MCECTLCTFFKQGFIATGGSFCSCDVAAQVTVYNNTRTAHCFCTWGFVALLLPLLHFRGTAFKEVIQNIRNTYGFLGSMAPPTKFFLDIFAGASMPVSTALSEFFGDRVQPIDLIHGHDLLHDDTFEDVLRLAAFGLIGAALAAPYCSKHSKATLKSPGPAPVRTPGWRSKKVLRFMIALELCFLKWTSMEGWSSWKTQLHP